MSPRSLAKLVVVGGAATLVTVFGAGAAQAEPVPCTVDDSPSYEQTGPGQFEIDLRTQVTCFGNPVEVG